MFTVKKKKGDFKDKVNILWQASCKLKSNTVVKYGGLGKAPLKEAKDAETII